MAGIRSYGPLILVSVFWGGAFVAIRQADFELSSVNLTLLRWYIASAAFLALYPFVAKPKTGFEWRDLPRLLVLGAFNVAVYHLSLNYSEKLVDASFAGLLISLAPLFGVVLSALILHEKVGKTVYLALLLGVAGTIVIFAPDLNLGIASLLGPLGVVLSSFASGAFTVSSKPLVEKYGPIPVVIWGSLVGTALISPLASESLVQQALALSSYGWASVLFLSLLSTVLGNTILHAGGPPSSLKAECAAVPHPARFGGGRRAGPR